MTSLPLKVVKSLEKRKNSDSFRELKFSKGGKDFSSNDYLGFAGSEEIYHRANDILRDNGLLKNGSGGSRLLTGNHLLYPKAEAIVAAYHRAEAALIFNSGYDANLGFFSAVPGKDDLILYDEFIHASIRDGIGLSMARAFKFGHNDLEDLQKKISRFKKEFSGNIFIVTESVFSMDGDMPPLTTLAGLALENNAFLIVDEAHAVGVYGAGLVPGAGLEDKIFARLVTFGKALGTHGAAILGPKVLKDYLVNYARSFIYSTALPPHAIASVLAAYEHLEGEGSKQVVKLQENIRFFRHGVSKRGFQEHFLESKSAIQGLVLSGNEMVKAASNELEEKGFDLRPIMSPTVPAGKERLRICIHSFNSEKEIQELQELLFKFV